MRIRTIKPEFWASESVGRLSREARLLFIGFWSLADDSGRGRGALPTISGSLFPYDTDAQKLLPKWVEELEKEKMIRRYKAEDGNTYFDIPNWLKHQKIEKPSAPKFPAFTEQSGNSRGIVGEGSPQDQGSGKGEEQGTGTKEGEAILAFLNLKAGREFRPTKENIKLIEARLSEVHGDIDGIQKMISRMVARWAPDPKMVEYLRPQTLFGKEKFSAYYDNRNLAIHANNTPGSAPAGTRKNFTESAANTRERVEWLAAGNSDDFLGENPPAVDKPGMADPAV